MQGVIIVTLPTLTGVVTHTTLHTVTKPTATGTADNAIQGK